MLRVSAWAFEALGGAAGDACSGGPALSGRYPVSFGVQTENEKSRHEMESSSKRQVGFGGFLDSFICYFLALILVIPITIVISILYIFIRLFLRVPPPFFYFGERLGKDQKIFTLIKIRTLDTDATGDYQKHDYRESEKRTIKGGDFLRKCRFDELPQIYNILKGDMAFVGPRPERPAMFEVYAQRIPNYKKRFGVKPGLTGCSQLLTAHSTPRRMRWMIDNRAYFSRQKRFNELYWILLTVWGCISHVFRNLLDLWGAFLERIFKANQISEARSFRRMKAPSADALVRFDGETEKVLPLSDVSRNSLSFWSNEPHNLKIGDRIEFVLKIRARDKVRRAKCVGTVSGLIAEERQGSGSVTKVVVSFDAQTPFNRYLLDQYLFQDSFL